MFTTSTRMFTRQAQRSTLQMASPLTSLLCVSTYHNSKKANRGGIFASAAATATTSTTTTTTTNNNNTNTNNDHVSAYEEYAHNNILKSLSTKSKQQNRQNTIDFHGANPRPDLLQSRLCLVTNCQKNVEGPEKIAQSLAKYGANVVVHSKSAKEARRIRDSLPIVVTGQQHFSVAADLTKSSASAQLVDQLQQVTGSLEVVVHNAALPKAPPADVVNCSTSDFDKVIDLNLKAPFALTQSLLPLLNQASKPSIIFSANEVEQSPLSSSPASTTTTKPGSYYVNKFSVKSSHMLTSMLSQQLEGVRVNAIDPLTPSAGTVESSTSDPTRAYVWLSRQDTEITGATLNPSNWSNRDPSLFTKDY